MNPFRDAGVEVDVVQMRPLAVYNFASFDQIGTANGAADAEKEEEEESEYQREELVEGKKDERAVAEGDGFVVLLDIGADNSDLVITDGTRIWRRNLPLGGNHFTRALTKELKLTFAKAEHLKRNATQADDPKALFQAMRPVFNDLLTEVQRSIGYFTNLDRRAKISRGVALGNAMKLPGLQRYLAQNLGFDLARVESFRGLSGTAVVDAPAFKENVLAFGVCYGLALQGLRDTKIKTNLLPREIVQERLVRAKKPWAVGAAAALLLGALLSLAFRRNRAQRTNRGQLSAGLHDRPEDGRRTWAKKRS
jgi:type IV pilus assembly protein PilM